MNNQIKGIELVWLSRTDLTNMNSGEGGTNFVDVKKYKKNGIEYPYVSGQAMRHYLRAAVRRELPTSQFMCLPNDDGEGCGDEKKCINCDLFGYMHTIRGTGAQVRVSPVKVSPAMGLLPMDDNSTIDFLTRKKFKSEEEKASGDIVNVELGVNTYKCGISIDLVRVGAKEEANNESRTLVIKPVIDDDAKKKRVINLLTAIMIISDYSKQSRLLTDFAPDILLGSVQERYSHRLQKALEIDRDGNLKIERFEAIVQEMKGYCDVYFGILPGILSNESDVKTKVTSLGLEILTPGDVIKKLIGKLN